ncbi:MAG: 1-deoxy-D-xylulose-5-phosphate synthase N-terminal domain-containing protein [Ramlibacter sp.]
MLLPEDITRARKRLLRMHFESGVGHIGGNLSALDAMLVVFHEHLRAGDQFVLSKGHAAGALYTALWSAGRLREDDLATFHRDGTVLSGHPPAGAIPDILFATGSLGHGLSLAAGTALALRLKKSQARVVCMMSDGEWQEGSTWEALIFACHHRLAQLTVLVDHNGLQGFGSTGDVASMSPLWDRLKGFDADVSVIDGHDPEAIRVALRSGGERFRIVMLETVKGHGVRFMENRMEWHYLPLSQTQFDEACRNLDTP